MIMNALKATYAYCFQIWTLNAPRPDCSRMSNGEISNLIDVIENYLTNPPRFEAENLPRFAQGIIEQFGYV